MKTKDSFWNYRIFRDLSVVFGVVSSGCAHEAPVKPPLATSSGLVSTAVSAPSFLELRPCRIFKGDEVKTILYPDGLLAENGQLLGQIQKDGRFVDLLGRVLVTMTSDGRIVLPHGTMRIDLDGTISMQMVSAPPEQIRIDSTGKVQGTKEDLWIEGLSYNTRRTAAYALILPDILRLQQEAQIH